MQSQLPYILPNGEKGFIPTGTLFKSVRTIAGNGTDTVLRVEQKLVDTYGGELGLWKKRAGKIESAKYMFDVHWYELNGKQYKTKLKFRRERIE